MRFRVRAAAPRDLEALYEMAKLAGGGLTNLPPDRCAIAEKLERSGAAFAASHFHNGTELYLFVLENATTREARGTAQLIARTGQSAPFYSYRLATLTQHSKELDRTFRAEMLNLVTDLEGSSEVGGLFVHPAERAAGQGLLLARSRYLFIAMHRARFSDRILAELRGVVDKRGASPFWDGIAGRFFGMSFHEADYFNALNGHQFIADLMPKHPIYLAMLPESACRAIGVPHPSGRAAMRMLEAEGFAYEGYVDIFDGGPTLIARTDRVASVAAARKAEVTVGEPDQGGRKALVATGSLAQFRCGFASVEERVGRLIIDPHDAAGLSVGGGETVWLVTR
jgi:arginine N-succinyltransferase